MRRQPLQPTFASIVARFASRIHPRKEALLDLRDEVRCERVGVGGPGDCKATSDARILARGFLGYVSAQLDGGAICGSNRCAGSRCATSTRAGTDRTAGGTNLLR